jgi:flagellar hook-length control protein FliK
MTDALPAAPATLLPALPPAGVAPFGRAPGLRDGLPGDRPASSNPGQEADPFALILMGFLGASRPATAPPPAPSPALAAAGIESATTTAAGSPLAGLAAGGAPPPALPAGAAGELPDLALAGKPLPPTGDDLPAGMADGALADPAETPRNETPNGPRSLPADLAGAAGAEAESVTREGSGLATRRGAAMDTLLAELALGRAALRGTPPPGVSPPGADPMAGLATGGEPPALAGDPPPPVLAGFNLANAPATAPGGNTATTAADAAGTLAGTLAAGQRSGGSGLAALGGSALAPLGDSATFATGLGERLVALGRDGLQTARLRLHPESLGALEVRIRVDAGQAEVWFGTGQADARDAIEGTLPRLREMFAAQGIELGRVQVELRPEPGAGPGWQAGSGPAAGDQRSPGRYPDPAGGQPAPGPRPPWADATTALAATTGRQRLLDVLA